MIKDKIENQKHDPEGLEADDFIKELLKFSLWMFRPFDPAMNSQSLASFKEQMEIKTDLKRIIDSNLIEPFEKSHNELEDLAFTYSLELSYKDIPNKEDKDRKNIYGNFIKFFEPFAERLKEFLKEYYKTYSLLDNCSYAEMEYFFFLKKLYIDVVTDSSVHKLKIAKLKS